jgi:hypothetical protein
MLAKSLSGQNKDPFLVNGLTSSHVASKTSEELVRYGMDLMDDDSEEE